MSAPVPGAGPPRWLPIFLAAVWTLLLLLCLLNVLRIMLGGPGTTLTFTLILLAGLSFSARSVWRGLRR